MLNLVAQSLHKLRDVAHMICFQGSWTMLVWSVGGITAALNAEVMLFGNSASVRKRVLSSTGVIKSYICMHK